MTWKSKNSIKLKSQIGLQLWKTWIMMWISIDLGKVSERILGYYELKQRELWFDEECSTLLDQEKEANCSGCKILTKQR